MPGYVSHHFIPKERDGAEPPWGLERKTLDDGNGALTTYGWMHRGLQGLPAKPIRNNTTNHFDPQNWRSRSDYREKFFTPQAYSRQEINKASPFRTHKPHAKIEWPLEPNKGYMIWKPKLADPEMAKAYSAPSLLRYSKMNNWKTTTQIQYPNYFLPGIPEPSNTQGSQRNQSKSSQRILESKLNSRDSHRPSTEDSRQTPPHLRTTYKGTFNGDPGRPSTDARLPDYSWRNIRY